MIRGILERILDGADISIEEAGLLMASAKSELLALMQGADAVRRKFCGNKIDLCSLINAKSGLCSEDCKFCSQSSRYKTGCGVYPLVSIEKMVSSASQAKNSGAGSFCIVISGADPTKKEFEKIKHAIARIKKEVRIEVDCSLGSMDMESAKELKALGVDRYNHNLETSENFYRNICTSHSYQNRLDTVLLAKSSGLGLCCGGIIGMGEGPKEQLDMAFTLKKLDVRCVPINILNPRKGTPLENIKPLHPLEILKTIAIFRLILPKATIKIAGGREYGLRDLQPAAFMAGANGMIIGGYLTTKGRSVKQDLQMVRDLGFEL